MDRSSAKGMLVGTVALAAIGGAVTPAGAVEVRERTDYVAVIVEAEEYATLGDRWIPTDSSTAPTPETTPDPDGNHSAGASGGVYLEVLPDHRQKHELTVPEGTPLSMSFWGPGDGPTLTYAVDFPEPGRYFVHVRAYSTGSEDNGIHIGLNGRWPQSGTALQLCTSGARDWRWSNKKRESGGFACGIRDTIWLDVAEAGPATLALSAREDGFELDRVMMIKDRSDNTRRCAPVFDEPDTIECTEGGVRVADDIVDLAVSLESPVEEGEVGDEVSLIARIGNRDDLDTATDVVLAIEADADDWRLVDGPEGCEREDGEIVCEVGELEPAPADEDARFELTFEALRDGLLRLEASATATEIDDATDNDSERVLVEIDEPIVPTTLAVRLGGLPGVTTPDTDVSLSFSVDNGGAADALDTALDITLPDGLEAGALPDGCSASGGRIGCAIGRLASGGSRDFTLTVRSPSEGDYAVAARASASNAPVGDVVGSLDVSEPEPVEPTPAPVVVPTPTPNPAPTPAPTGQPSVGGEEPVEETPAQKQVTTSGSGGGAGGPSLAFALAAFALLRRRGRSAV